MSYAQAVNAATRVSLMNNHILSSHSDDAPVLSTLQTRIYRAFGTKGAHLFHIFSAKGKYTDHQSMISRKEQYPSVYACVPLTDEPRHR
ncbi:hypothetical protein BCV72DRAFT_227457 [Rhizopus microsporus var. microsporus]|uniref:Uncharacterized protein n=1 Tax=Rhizopus microsporus var. microsporus TaxID=86635 RepID=A0A1X0R4W5_RHIZD|nr:hypothetical protein BCV72DRAFT_227457 [Rhizopus microsporus var. microsporus]